MAYQIFKSKELNSIEKYNVKNRKNYNKNAMAKIKYTSEKADSDTVTIHSKKDGLNYIEKWRRSLTILNRGHWDAARYYEKVNLGLGMATAITAAISGTTAFTQIQDQANQNEHYVWLQIAIGIFAITAASLSAIQAFVRPSEQAARHKQAGQKFGKLRREIELHLNLGLPSEHKERETLLTEFRERWDAVDEESLPVPKKIYDKVEKEYDK